MIKLRYLLILAAFSLAMGYTYIDSIRIGQVTDGCGLVRVCYRARNLIDTTLAVNIQARWPDSSVWHIPVVTLHDTVSGYSDGPNHGWRVSADSTGRTHCFIWDMSTDIGPVEGDGFKARVTTFDSLVSTFNVIDSFPVCDSARPDMRAFGLTYKHGKLWVLYHNEVTHDCWIRPYSLPDFIEGDSIHIGTVTVGPSDMAFAGDRLFWVEDTRLLLKEFDFSTGLSNTVRGDWWGLPGTSLHIAGAAFDGEHLWVCFSAGTFIALDTSDFSLVDTMFFPEFGISTPETSADGLAWGLGLLWCYSNDNIAYAIDIEMDSIIHAIPTGDVVEATGAEGAAWDGINLWVVDYARGFVYKLLLYRQIKLYESDFFPLDNIPPDIEWRSPRCPDFADTFVAGDTVELLWSVSDSNLAGGNTSIFLDDDTVSILASTDTVFLWNVNPWPGFHSSFDIVISDSFGNATNTASCEFVIRGVGGIGERSDLPGEVGIIAYPNPFNSAVGIRVLGFGSRVSGIEIFDINGRMVWGKGARDLGLGSSPHTTQPLGSGEGSSPYALYPNPSVASGSVREFIWQPDESLGSGIYLARARFDKLTDQDEDKLVTKRIVYLK